MTARSHPPAASSVRTAPLPSWPQFDEEEVAAATTVLQSGRVNYWTGDQGRQFEQEYANYVGVGHAVAVANGTVSLELILRALHLQPGDEVVVSPRSFIASVSCVVAVGARPVFADVDAASGNLSAATVEQVLTARTRAILAVHLAGWPCDLDALGDLARARGIALVEDCAQAHGATWRGRQVGSFGQASSFSFCQDKIITTGGEGGMITTADRALWSEMWSLKDHGKSYEACFHRQWPPGFRWLHESFGSNYRLTEMQSAIGRVALRRLPERLAARRRNAAVLTRCFSRFDWIRDPQPPSEAGHAYYRYYCYVRTEALRAGWNRDRVLQEITTRGVPCFSGSCSEIYLEKAFDQAGLRPDSRLPVARELGETSLAFLVHPTLTESDLQWMDENIAAVMRSVVR